MVDWRALIVAGWKDKKSAMTRDIQTELMSGNCWAAELDSDKVDLLVTSTALILAD